MHYSTRQSAGNVIAGAETPQFADCERRHADSFISFQPEDITGRYAADITFARYGVTLQNRDISYSAAGRLGDDPAKAEIRERTRRDFSWLLLSRPDLALTSQELYDWLEVPRLLEDRHLEYSKAAIVNGVREWWQYKLRTRHPSLQLIVFFGSQHRQRAQANPKLAVSGKWCVTENGRLLTPKAY